MGVEEMRLRAWEWNLKKLKLVLKLFCKMWNINATGHCQHSNRINFFMLVKITGWVDYSFFHSLFLSQHVLSGALWNTTWWRIWCKSIQDVGNKSANILHLIMLILSIVISFLWFYTELRMTRWDCRIVVFYGIREDNGLRWDCGGRDTT